MIIINVTIQKTPVHSFFIDILRSNGSLGMDVGKGYNRCMDRIGILR